MDGVIHRGQHMTAIVIGYENALVGILGGAILSSSAECV